MRVEDLIKGAWSLVQHPDPVGCHDVPEQPGKVPLAPASLSSSLLLLSPRGPGGLFIWLRAGAGHNRVIQHRKGGRPAAPGYVLQSDALLPAAAARLRKAIQKPAGKKRAFLPSQGGLESLLPRLSCHSSFPTAVSPRCQIF